MNVLVTGSAGFLGTDLVPRLQAQGHRVIGLDRRAERLSDLALRHDLRTPLSRPRTAAIAALAPEACVHLASPVGGFLYNTSRTRLPGEQAAIDETVLRLCEQVGCKRMVFTSTIHVFEVSGGFEHAPLRRLDQRSYYAIAKAQAEQRLQAAMPNLTVLRPTNLYGRRQARRHPRYGESHVIPDLLRKLEHGSALDVLGDGTQRRNFLHVSDVSRFVALRLSATSQVHLNLRSNLTLSIAELARALMAAAGREKPLRFHPEHMRHELFALPDFDLGPALALGFSPSVAELRDGLSR